MNSFGVKPKSNSKDDPYYKQQIKYYIFKEAYQQYSEARRLNNSNYNILLTDIQKKYPASGPIDEYRIEQ